MKQTVKIQGLDCPNCALSLEKELNKLDGVKNVEIDFVKSSLSFESDDCESALTQIVKMTKKLEPDAVIVQKTKKKLSKIAILDLILLVLGVGIGVLIYFLPLPMWAYWTLYTVAALMIGYKTYYKAIRQLFKGIVNENLLITISVIGASFVSEHMEGLMVITLYTIGKMFESMAVGHARASIESLAKIQPEYVNLITKKGEEQISPSEVKIGSEIVVRAGERVAIDGIITDGVCMVDLQSLTGESVPVTLKKGDEILSGSIVLDSVIKVKTTKIYSDSTISKIMNLVENASENKSKTETFISKITKYYTLGVVALAILVWGIYWAVSKNFNDAFYTGLIFLVISCPCAFAISVPLSYFSGLGNASRNGILIKGSNYLDACCKLKSVAFDKTGTLTTGQFEIEKIKTFGMKEKDVLYLAALGEQNSTHPLAKAITSACKKKLVNVENVKEQAGKGVSFNFKGKSYFVGRKDKKLENTVVQVFENDVEIGQIFLSDTIKHSSKKAIDDLKKLGVKTFLLSGDNEKIATKVATELGIDTAYSQMLPQDKYDFLAKQKGGYVGDGINDAPSLAVADVGFSMGINGSPASVEASDVVLVGDDPSKIATAIKISKYTRKIVLENIILSAVIKVLFLCLGVAHITAMFWAVFADVGVTVIAILNSIRALKYKAK